MGIGFVCYLWRHGDGKGYTERSFYSQIFSKSFYQEFWIESVTRDVEKILLCFILVREKSYVGDNGKELYGR